MNRRGDAYARLEDAPAPRVSARSREPQAGGRAAGGGRSGCSPAAALRPPLNRRRQPPPVPHRRLQARVDTLFEESKKVSGANITVRKALSAAQSALDHAAKKRAAKGSAAAHVARTSEGLRRLSALPTAQLLAAPYVADWLVCQLPGLVEQVNDAGSTAAAEAAAKELWSSVCRRAVLYLQASDWVGAAGLGGGCCAGCSVHEPPAPAA